MGSVEVLERGLYRVEQGWTQGTMHDEVDGFHPFKHKHVYCAVGALSRVDAESRIDALRALYNALPDAFQLKRLDRETAVIRFNDNTLTTKGDVVKLFKKAIAAEKARLNYKQMSAKIETVVATPLEAKVASLEKEMKELRTEVDALGASHEATSKNFRGRLRKLESKVKATTDELPKISSF